MVDHAEPLREEDVDPDPVLQFERWFEEAGAAGVRAPEAMAVATASRDGAPAIRMVLLKGHGPAGFVFFTNYDSHKGRDLAGNPRAALLFHWDELGRQVRIEGDVERVSREETVAYARSRPRGSQLGAVASAQSQVIPSRAALEQRVAELTRDYEGAEVPVPEHWGGFRVIPALFEFWQHRNDRLHDRLRYRLERDGSWRIERLAP